MMSNTTRMDGSVPGGIWAYIRDMYGDFENNDEVRSISHWSPYDRVRVVNAVP